MTVRKADGSTIFQRMWRNGHERTRVDTHCDPALAADISNVNDGYFYHFVTERPERSLLPPSRTSYVVPALALSILPGRAPVEGLRPSYLVPRTSYLVHLTSYLVPRTSTFVTLTSYLSRHR